MEGNYQKKLIEEYQRMCKGKPRVRFHSRNLLVRNNMTTKELIMPRLASPFLPQFKLRSTAPIFVRKRLIISKGYNRRAGMGNCLRNSIMENDEQKYKLIIKAIKEIKLKDTLKHSFDGNKKQVKQKSLLSKY